MTGVQTCALPISFSKHYGKTDPGLLPKFTMKLHFACSISQQIEIFFHVLSENNVSLTIHANMSLPCDLEKLKRPFLSMGFREPKMVLWRYFFHYHVIFKDDMHVRVIVWLNIVNSLTYLNDWSKWYSFPFSDTSYDMQHFSCDSLVFQHAHRERLTFSYYLRHGRPSFAFVAFIGEKLKDVNVSKAR